jgi:hypothetical protein
VLEFKAEYAMSSTKSDKPEHFLAVDQSQIHPELLAKIKQITVN